MPGRTGGKITLVAFTGQRFGNATVTEPEIRLGQSEAKPYGYRYARLRCDCGGTYLAQLSHLYQGRGKTCADCSRRAQYSKRRRVGGRVYKANRGWCVSLYVGHYKSRREAEEAARRARVVLVPDVKDRPAVNTL